MNRKQLGRTGIDGHNLILHLIRDQLPQTSAARSSVQDLGEHLHAREGRDAQEGNGESGRGVWEQGEMRLLRRFRAHARFSSFLGRCGAGGSVV